MNDETYEGQKARLQVLIDRWTPLLGLRWWEVVHEYARAQSDMPEEAKEYSLAWCTVWWPYLRARIAWSMEHVKDTDDDYLEQAFIHECMHILVREMRDDADHEDIDHEERVCSMLARAFIWTRAQGLRGDT